MVEFDQMWFTCIFQHTCSLPCSPHTSSIGVAELGFPQYRSSHPDPQKSPQLKIWPHYSSNTASQQSVVFFQVGEQKIVRWCQTRRIWKVINQFKAKVTHSSHCNHRLVCRSIVLVKQDSLCQFPGHLQNVSSTTPHSPELLIQCGFL